ncbi:trichohyalin [Biomphalaria pfeifferi]|uniref:Trichohyalin n=1 Tax=Biomphalaria pfeifferi TaxID=112525 RepID=A0AAD8BU48_BIOPF|nr:trichohyalin [Biomphalaria pfeifferi]
MCYPGFVFPLGPSCTAMLSSQHPPLPPQQDFHHRTYQLVPGIKAPKAMRNLDEGEGDVGNGVLRKPSRLEQMRSEYQKMLLKKKEEKMLQVYEENQKRTTMRAARAGSGGGYNAIATRQGNVREFFNERRRLAANGMPVPAIDNHYRQVKGHSSPADWSSRTGSGSSIKTQKSSAGRDRAHPLAPIQRAQDHSDSGIQNGRSGIPLRRQTNDQGDGNPFDDKPKMVKHPPLPVKNYHVDNNNNGGVKASALPRFNPSNRTQSHPNLARSPQVNRKISSEEPVLGGKMTEFQKWQMEQNKARENRLRKLNHRQHEEDNEGAWPDPEDDPRFAGGLPVDDDQDDESSAANAKIKELERQLLEKIAKEQSELKRIQMERKKEEDEEKKEIERQKKKEAAERARLKKLEDDRKKEEARRRQQDEEDEKLEMEREAKWKVVEEQKRKGRTSKMEERNKLKTIDQRLKDEFDDEEKNEKQFKKFQPRPPDKVSSPAKRFDPNPSRSKASVHDQDDNQPPTSDANYYLNAAASSDANGSVGRLEKCSLCGRSFAPDRLGKHEKACMKASKPRKEFDSSKKRVEGTELAKYAGKAKRPDPPKKKSNWRTQHQNFIESLRYAKKVTQIEKEGGDLRNLAPPPRTIDPDLVPCPHCGRKFNETAAERHIPRCKDLKTRPPPINTRRK